MPKKVKMKENTRRRSSRKVKQAGENLPDKTGGSRKLPISENVIRTRQSRSVSAYENSTQRKRSKSNGPVLDKSPGRKRKRSTSLSLERSITKRIFDGRAINSFCWVCHKVCNESVCNYCPRVYHKNCLKKLKCNSNSGQSSLCECQLKSVDGRNENLKWDARELKRLLQYVMQEAIKPDKKNKSERAENSKFCRLFQTWPPENDVLCKVMDLNILIDNMNGEEPYLSTGQFFCDVKWIYHNCCILYGTDCEITETALKLEKNFKLELMDIEACGECYRNKYCDNYLHADFFANVCRYPHQIIWAKLRGSPYWPAKCMKIQNGHVDVRFFGTHDKSNITIDKCFKISKRSPNNRRITQAKYQDAMRELSIYISNYENTFRTRFTFYEQGIPLEDGIQSPKKLHRKGRRKYTVRVPRIESVSGVDEMTDSKGKTLESSDRKTEAFQYLENFMGSENNENISESVSRVQDNSNMVCQMTFTADEHNGPASELNNPDEFLQASTSQYAMPEVSLNSEISLPSLNGTSNFLSDANVLPFVTITKADQNSVNFYNIINPSESNNDSSLPVITSTESRTEIPHNTISAESGALNSLPIITSTTSACENADYVSQDIPGPSGSAETSVNGELGAEPSVCVAQPLNEQIKNLVKESNLNLYFGEDEPEDEIQIISEEGNQTKKAHTVMKHPIVVNTITEILLATRPDLRKHFMSLQAKFMHAFVSMYMDTCYSKLDHRDIKVFLEVSSKCLNRNVKLEKDTADLIEQVKKLTEELEIMRNKANQKHLLKDFIIAKASQKVKTNMNESECTKEQRIKELEKKMEQCEASEQCLIQKNISLCQQLSEMKESIELKDLEIKSLTDSKGELMIRLDAQMPEVKTCEVQTDPNFFYETIPKIEEPSELLEYSEPNAAQPEQQESHTTRTTTTQIVIRRETFDITKDNDVQQDTFRENPFMPNYQPSLMSVVQPSLMPGVSTGYLTVTRPVPPLVNMMPPPGPIFHARSMDQADSISFLDEMMRAQQNRNVESSPKPSGRKKKKHV